VPSLGQATWPGLAWLVAGPGSGAGASRGRPGWRGWEPWLEGAGPAGWGGRRGSGPRPGLGAGRPGPGERAGWPAAAQDPALVTLSEHGNPYSGKIGVLITGLFRIALMAYLTLYRNPGCGAAQMAGTGHAGAVCGARRTGGTGAVQGGRRAPRGAAAGAARPGARRTAAGSRRRGSDHSRHGGRAVTLGAAGCNRSRCAHSGRRRPPPAGPARRRSPRVIFRPSGRRRRPAKAPREPRPTLDAMSKCRQSTGSFCGPAAITERRVITHLTT
jgi:hypothetical protein